MKPSEIEKKVDNLPSPQKRSRRGKVSRKMLAVIAIIVGCFVITASAGLLSYYGQIQMTATVSQSILVDGNDWTNPVLGSFAVTGGCTVCRPHWIKNNACIAGNVSIGTTITGPSGPSGVTVTYKVQATDDNTNWGNNEVVAFTSVGLTLDTLFAGAGLSYT